MFNTYKLDAQAERPDNDYLIAAVVLAMLAVIAALTL